jgi:hypothetical protein
MKKLREFAFYALLILLSAGAGPVGAGVWQWSRTADNNAGADPSISWAEGMSPSSVNDSARAMMAQIANYRDDISGLLTTGGSSTAYTVTTNSGLCVAPASTTTPLDGQLLSVTVNSTNGVSPTLTADGCNAFPIQTSPGIAVASATLVNGSPYNLRFSTANSAWMLKGFYASATNIPLGGLMPFTLMTSPNSNFIFPAGQCISTVTYATYWNALGSPGPGSCGANQFAVVDLSGNAPVGLDTMPGFSAKNRLTSSSTGCGTAMTTVGAQCANGGQTTTLLVANLPPYTPSGSISNNVPGTWSLNGAGGAPFPTSSSSNFGYVTIVVNSTFTGNAQGGTSTPMPRVMPAVGVTYLLRVL